MDGLGLKRGSVLGLHPIDPSQKRAAGFARAILQKRRSTPCDGVNLAKHGKVIDDKTEPGDMVVMDRTGVVVVPSGKIAEVGQLELNLVRKNKKFISESAEMKMSTLEMKDSKIGM